MSSLAGYNYRKLVKKIKKFGFSYYRQAKDGKSPVGF